MHGTAVQVADTRISTGRPVSKSTWLAQFTSAIGSAEISFPSLRSIT